jgi:hypothetical protein
VRLSLNLIENLHADARVNFIAEERRFVPLQQLISTSVFICGESAFCAVLQMSRNQPRVFFFQIAANIECQQRLNILTVHRTAAPLSF